MKQRGFSALTFARDFSIFSQFFLQRNWMTLTFKWNNVFLWTFLWWCFIRLCFFESDHFPEAKVNCVSWWFGYIKRRLMFLFVGLGSFSGYRQFGCPQKRKQDFPLKVVCWSYSDDVAVWYSPTIPMKFFATEKSGFKCSHFWDEFHSTKCQNWIWCISINLLGSFGLWHILGGDWNAPFNVSRFYPWMIILTKVPCMGTLMFGPPFPERLVFSSWRRLPHKTWRMAVQMGWPSEGYIRVGDVLVDWHQVRLRVITPLFWNGNVIFWKQGMDVYGCFCGDFLVGLVSL